MAEDQPKYPNLPELREALTSDEPDRRGQAYSDVYEAGFQPSDVLSNDPPAEDLAEAGLVPGSSPSQPPASERWSEVVSLLEDIRDELQGGSQ